MDQCNSGTAELRRISAPSLIAAFLTGAGLAATAFFIVRKVRQTGVGGTVESLMRQCDEAAAALDERMSQVTRALAG